MNTTELVKSVSIDNLLNQRTAVLDKLTQGLALLREAYQLAAAANVGFPDIGMNCRQGSNFDLRIAGNCCDSLPQLLASATKVVDARAWAYLMSESGLRTFMAPLTDLLR